MKIFGLTLFTLFCCLFKFDFGFNNKPSLDAVIVTTAKDSRVLEKSIISSLKYLIDVNKYYIITPNAMDMKEKFGSKFSTRVIFIDESIFPFSGANVSEIMIETVKQRGVYPLSGKTNFEHTVWGRIGWFLQQLLKFYAGRVLGLNDYLLMDSDIVWFRNVSFINQTIDNNSTKYNYASSTQYHPPYVATLRRITGLNLFESKIYRSGICHHMVMVKSVLEDLITKTEKRYNGLPFWQVLLNERFYFFRS
jgi:hypothetical protein